MSYPEISKAIREQNLATLIKFSKEKPRELAKLTPFGPWLHFAAAESSCEIVNFFLELGADIDARYDFELDEISSTGSSAICRAASYGKADIVLLLLESGATLQTETSLCNPLFGAIYSRSVDVVTHLINAGIDLSISYPVDANSRIDALTFAIESGEIGIAQIIARVQAGGDAEKAAFLIKKAKETVAIINA